MPNPFHALVARRTGMALSELQCRRLDEKLAARPGGASVQFLLHLQGPQGAADLAELIDAIAVQKTELFRDDSQLTALRTHVLEPLVARERRPLRLWSAGCATGEEVATLLVLLAEVGADPASTVLGTDISESALVRARELSFSAEQLQRVPGGMRERWFVPAASPGRFTLPTHLRERASFVCHNLMDAPYPTAPEAQGFDVILCRNVLIYFTPDSFSRVVLALGERLAPQGLLVLSAAEPLLNAPPSLRTLRYDQAFFYARAPESTAPPGAGLPRTVSGRFPVVEVPKAGSGRFPAVEPPKAGSGRFPAVEPPKAGSGRFPAVEVPKAGSGRFPTVEVPKAGSGRFPTVAPPRTGSGRFPAVGLPKAGSGRFPAVGASEPPGAPSVPASPRGESLVETRLRESGAYSEADALFSQVLEWAASGSHPSPQTAETLRRCLLLDPDLAAARYLLGLVLEQRGALAEAAGEYRRALRSLEEGRARATPFFLNNVRLQVACARAIERVERSAPPRP